MGPLIDLTQAEALKACVLGVGWGLSSLDVNVIMFLSFLSFRVFYYASVLTDATGVL